MISAVRTTLDVDDDILLAAKELAVAQGSTAGKVLSNLARKGLEAPKISRKMRNGVPLLPRRPVSAAKPTLKLVNDLRDEP
jgi:hypothetical protein